MNFCKLCKSNEANQTGSHLTSCFMVNSMLGERDKEMGYLISGGGNDYTINHGSEMIKEDYIFCIGCESRLSYLEGYFSSEYTNKVDNSAFAQNFEQVNVDGTLFTKPKKINPTAFHMLINSVIWRAHLSNKPLFVKFRIPEKVAENIRLTLDSTLPIYENYKVKGKLAKWIKEIEAIKDIIPFFPYIIFRTDLVGQNRTQNLIYFSDIENSPYHCIINEFIILTYFEDSNNNQSQDYFELSNEYNLNELLNDDSEDLKIGNLAFDKWEEIRVKLSNTIIGNLKLRKVIRDCFNLAVKRRIPISIDYMMHCIECRKNKL